MKKRKSEAVKAALFLYIYIPKTERIGTYRFASVRAILMVN